MPTHSAGVHEDLRPNDLYATCHTGEIHGGGLLKCMFCWERNEHSLLGGANLVCNLVFAMDGADYTYLQEKDTEKCRANDSDSCIGSGDM